MATEFINSRQSVKLVSLVHHCGTVFTGHLRCSVTAVVIADYDLGDQIFRYVIKHKPNGFFLIIGRNDDGDIFYSRSLNDEML